MNSISAVTVGKLIEAHMENDNDKFISYARFLAEGYRQQGDLLGASIIESKLDSSYKDKAKITLDQYKEDLE